MSTPSTPSLARRVGAEIIGTFWLVLAGCGTAVLAATATTTATASTQTLFVGVGYVGVALAFGLAVTTAAYGLGHISGGHFNPAVSLGLAVAGRLPWRDLPAYVVGQLVGAVLGAGVLYAVASGRSGFDAATGFATNGYGAQSPQQYGLAAVLVTEVVLTAVFVVVILGATDTPAPKGFAPLAIGLTLTVIHLVSIPVSNTSVNPARSIAPALFAGGTALGQLWVFVVAPLAGGVLAALLHRAVLAQREQPAPQRVSAES
ncbi:aquaporin Z [Terracoccus luteus]|uniref:Aquaporin Z n=1 Tax=Terracoccus luteus TaxID=53356 RepID=A0A839Q0A1_9MICO|nr:aquaporin Z [Terracoccus luteus]MBB2988384.1 aquaporin Z [Terracoccus luteus]MCP2173986.1 aquaporin Z [Terracoccus luteus]